ncbi:MAG: HigA family addiction module antidote protein [Bacteroidia bacterium]|nr:HigA family addiction module antidote protein [Bacteroidia bacterium]
MNKTEKKIANLMIPGDLFHPGEHLKEEIAARDMSQQELADKLHVSKSEISLIINGRRNITPIIAVKLEKSLGINAEFWMNIQIKYDIDLVKKKYQQDLQKAKIPLVKKGNMKKLISAA